MNCRIAEEPVTHLGAYGEIPIKFEVQSVFEIDGDDPNTATLVEKPLAQPWIKDYDVFEREGPTHWSRRWDISNWGMLAAYANEQLVGGCVLAYNTDSVNKLEDRDDLVALWDLRIHPDYRRKGIGSQLFEAAIQWARERQCRELKIETQNINVPACRFYKRQGCHLCSIDRSAYDECPEETELIWGITL